MFSADTLAVHFQLLSLKLLLQAAATPHLSTKPWKDYSFFDYPSSNDYCLVCLLDENDLTTTDKDVGLCWLPVIAPNGAGVNLNALLAAQKTLLDPDSLDFPVGEGERQQAAQKLVQIMRSHDVQPDAQLSRLGGQDNDEG